jgi:hypothetical protein
VANVPTSGGDGPSITNKLDPLDNPKTASSWESLHRRGTVGENTNTLRNVQEGKELSSLRSGCTLVLGSICYTRDLGYGLGLRMSAVSCKHFVGWLSKIHVMLFVYPFVIANSKMTVTVCLLPFVQILPPSRIWKS